MLFSLVAFAAIASRNLELYRMSSNEPPPNYYGTTNMSEKPITVTEKPAKAASHHITLQRCKRIILLDSGRHGIQGLIEDYDFAITISPDEEWPEIRARIFRLFQKAWPDRMGDADYEDYGLSISAQYSTHNGDIYGCIQLLESVDDGLWDFLKRDDIQIINLIASSAPRRGQAPGELSRFPRKPLVRGLEMSGNQAKGKSKHRCVLQ
jgi:hypothetical protein